MAISHREFETVFEGRATISFKIGFCPSEGGPCELVILALHDTSGTGWDVRRNLRR